jgi:hypothetical protein
LAQIGGQVRTPNPQMSALAHGTASDAEQPFSRLRECFLCGSFRQGIQDVGAFFDQQALKRSYANERQPCIGIMFDFFIHEASDAIATPKGCVAEEFDG